MTNIRAPKYTPYRGGTSFAIGLSALDPKRWIEPDAHLVAFLAEKERLRATEFDTVFRAVPGSEPGQSECLDLLLAHLLDDHGGTYARSGDRVDFAGLSVDLSADAPPLIKAGSLVQDDLVILSKRPEGWTVVAGYVAFPSSWSLPEKAGHPMEVVHAHVPGFEGGTRNATMINRIFDNLQPDLPAVRLNWSIYPEGDLFWPPERGARHGDRPFTAATNFIRVERQVLRRLPKTGDIVFSIRIYSDPIASLLALGDGTAAVRSLIERLEAFTPAQLAYKGMAKKKAALIAYLEDLAEQKSDSPA
jgi:hypothetical protein